MLSSEGERAGHCGKYESLRLNDQCPVAGPIFVNRQPRFLTFAGPESRYEPVDSARLESACPQRIIEGERSNLNASFEPERTRLQARLPLANR